MPFIIQKWQKGRGCAYIIVMKYLSRMLLVLFIVGCSDNLEKQTSELVNAKYKWLEVTGESDYSFNYKRNCFCALAGKNILIKVKDNKIVSAKSEGKEVSSKRLLTITGSFIQILELLKQQEREGSVSVEVEYDSKFGYPTKITTERIPFAHDAQMTQYLSNFIILTNNPPKKSKN